MEANQSIRLPLGYASPLRGDEKGNVRILLVGNSGTGKSTMAGNLAKILHFPVIYLDRLYWQPNWKETPDDQFRGQIQAFARENDNWIIDGNFKSVVGDLTFAIATDVIWLDPPFALYFPRIIVRTFLRLFRLTPPCSPGCDETLSDVLTCGVKSILWWCWTQHTPLREFYSGKMQEPGENNGGKWTRLGGRGSDARRWLKQVEALTKGQ